MSTPEEQLLVDLLASCAANGDHSLERRLALIRAYGDQRVAEATRQARDTELQLLAIGRRGCPT